MTAEEKRDRRKARHETQREMERFVNRRMGLFSTASQLKAAVKTHADRFISAQVKQS